MQIIDNGIEKLALKLQQRQNLSHIEFLKIRLGMQVVVINITKAIVTYGLALLLHVFLYTLVVHCSYAILRFFSHGAHAKNSIFCHIQNIVFFIVLPWFIVQYDISFVFMLCLAAIGWFLVMLYAPAATKKQPIAQHRRKGLHFKSVIVMTLIIIISFVIPAPYQQLFLYGSILQSSTLLPIFFPKEAEKL